MKVNINLEIDDARRNRLAQVLDGKAVKRIATRDEVRDFVNALIESVRTRQRLGYVSIRQDPVCSCCGRDPCHAAGMRHSNRGG